MKNTHQVTLDAKRAEPGFCRIAAFLLAATVFAANPVFASSDDAWEEFRKEVSTKMESAIAGTFASHSLFVEPFGSESYGLAIASGVSAGGKEPLTVFGIYRKETKTLEIIEVPEAVFERKGAAAGDQKTAATEPKGATKSNAELLQGKWRHVEDKNNLLLFEKNVRKESSDGGKTWDKTTFVLGTQCENPSNAGHPTETSGDSVYISTADDLCWNLESVDKNELFLNFVGRGNTLKYVRVTK